MVIEAEKEDCQLWDRGDWPGREESQLRSKLTHHPMDNAIHIAVTCIRVFKLSSTSFDAPKFPDMFDASTVDIRSISEGSWLWSVEAQCSAISNRVRVSDAS